MFDTHCHLNFKAFQKTLPDVIDRAYKAGVSYMLIPGTDLEASRRAVEIAKGHKGVYAAVGIHPHHALESLGSTDDRRKTKVDMIEELLREEKVLAVGEVGIDKYQYKETKYKTGSINPDFIERQKELFVHQIQLAIQHKKSLILHNREAVEDTLLILKDHWGTHLEGRTVFHCCEPDKQLLEFAKKHRVYIGVDGDVTYNKKKQEFIKTVPLELLVLETDSPFLLPEPLRSQKKYPNEPANLASISAFLGDLLNIEKDELARVTTQNAKKLFTLGW
ncbi:hydrolase TatD [Candidatus Roizmanbacteria bacterium CG09_land_8_20_14_0_10_41_9]|uniref:Hydrolase TatD n=1 Tax=Candidatus Roizmanbacteria bacterium CG09_land_8_20_14_0_10_41_9 TaxID=1974850 RepID=A0A2H0WS82_9BACT|nr:MAG: hydrolase TatD [Candidatus Roizmanbacteria bacterium CG09_land_8_20_14_0_10_41_9]